MPGRIGRAFEAARGASRGAFLPYVTSGFPDPVESDRLVAALCEEGADLLELGVPFSDPLADGPIIQETTRQALRAGTTLERVLAQAARLRARFQTPLVLMTYVNPVVRYGAERFAASAREAGIDGVILVDLPPEEDPALWEAVRGAGLDTILLVAPSTDPRRLPLIAARASGFLYVVARLGVTGAGAGDPELGALLRRCREHSPLPRCVGFGFGATSDLAPLSGLAEGVIVGSALLEELLEARDASARLDRARAFARKIQGKLPQLAR